MNYAGKNTELTPKEFEVLKLVAQGYNNKEIAKELNISIHTAKAHVSAILDKMGAESRVKAAVIAVQEGIVDAFDIAD